MAYQRRDIFLHFLNRDSRQIYGLFRGFESLRHGFLLARALNAAAILCETRCLAPPGFIIECDIAQAMMERKSAYLRERLVELPMREESLTDLVEKKRQEYAPMRASYEGLFDDQRVRFLADNASGLIRRKAVIGANIANNWRAGPDENKRLWRPVTTIVPAHSIESLRMIPEQLIESGTAATWAVILGLLAMLPTPKRNYGESCNTIISHCMRENLDWSLFGTFHSCRTISAYGASQKSMTTSGCEHASIRSGRA
jgi:hypothetical protein